MSESSRAFLLAEYLRDLGLTVVLGRNQPFKKQLREANRIGARYVVWWVI